MENEYCRPTETHTCLIDLSQQVGQFKTVRTHSGNQVYQSPLQILHLCVEVY